MSRTLIPALAGFRGLVAQTSQAIQRRHLQIRSLGRAAWADTAEAKGPCGDLFPCEGNRQLNAKRPYAKSKYRARQNPEVR
jgi:hypothetical protein